MSAVLDNIIPFSLPAKKPRIIEKESLDRKSVV